MTFRGQRIAFLVLGLTSGTFIGALAERAIDEREYGEEFVRLDRQMKEAHRRCDEAADVLGDVEMWRSAAQICFSAEAQERATSASAWRARRYVARNFRRAAGEETRQLAHVAAGISSGRLREPSADRPLLSLSSPNALRRSPSIVASDAGKPGAASAVREVSAAHSGAVNDGTAPNLLHAEAR